MESYLCTLDTPPCRAPPVAHSPENGVYAWCVRVGKNNRSHSFFDGWSGKLARSHTPLSELSIQGVEEIRCSKRRKKLAREREASFSSSRYDYRTRLTMT